MDAGFGQCVRPAGRGQGGDGHGGRSGNSRTRSVPKCAAPAAAGSGCCFRKPSISPSTGGSGAGPGPALAFGAPSPDRGVRHAQSARSPRSGDPAGARRPGYRRRHGRRRRRRGRRAARPRHGLRRRRRRVSANAPAPAKGPATPSPERQKYDAERAGVMKLRNELGKHPQRAHVKDQTDISDPALGAANAAAAKPDWPKAMAELAKARTACVDGKRFADAVRAGDRQARRRQPAAHGGEGERPRRARPVSRPSSPAPTPT